MKDFFMLIKNKNYLLAATIFGLIYCVYAEIGIQISILLYPFNQYSHTDYAIIAIFFVFFGAISAASMGIVLDRTGKYLFIFRLMLILATFILVLSFLMIPSESKWIGFLWGALAGIFLVPIVPITFNFVTEITHPLSPATVINFTLIIANIFLTFVNFVFLGILKNKTAGDSLTAFGLMAVIAAFSCFLSVFVKEDLRRMASLSDLRLVSSQS